MELQVGVKILLENREGKFLFVQRSPDKYKEIGNQWDIVGGRIHPGITLIENLKREVEEETGLKITEEPKLIYAQDILRMMGKHVVRLTYKGKADGEVKLSDEHCDFRWLSLKEISEIEPMDIYLKEVLEKL